MVFASIVSPILAPVLKSRPWRLWLRCACLVLVASGMLAINVCVLAFSEPQAAPERPAAQASAPSPIVKTKLLQLEMQPTQQIYSSREGLTMLVTLTARQRVRMCLARDVLSQMQVKISQSGRNRPLKPLIVKDNSQVFQQPMTIRWLEAGDKLTYRVNLKRFYFADGSKWVPGEYSVQATYNLCEQSESATYDPAADEIPIRMGKATWFMIMS